MRWKPDLNLTTNARVFTAIYLGALVMGPPLMNLGGSDRYADDAMTGFTLLAVMLFMPLLGGYVAGRVAGPGHGIRAAILAYFVSRSALIMNKLFWDACVWHATGLALSVVDVLLTSFIPCVFIAALAQHGERRAAQRQEEAPYFPRQWHAIALVLLLCLIFTYTLGGRLAVQRHDPTGEKHFEPFPAGAYVGLTYKGLDDCEAGKMYYTDPTGLAMIGWYDIPNCMCGDRLPPLGFLGW